jgi:hypothetical protein
VDFGAKNKQSISPLEVTHPWTETNLRATYARSIPTAEWREKQTARKNSRRIPKK